jgi:Zn finger protein HypA/HybF involved in hydrogenase expression
MAGLPPKQIKDKAAQRLAQMQVKYNFTAWCRDCKKEMHGDYPIEVCLCGSDNLTVSDHGKLETKILPMDNR